MWSLEETLPTFVCLASCSTHRFSPYRFFFAPLFRMAAGGLFLLLLCATILIVVVVILVNRRRWGMSLRQTSKRASGELRVVFVHPDLGIGGAERLIVDACVGLRTFRKCQTVIVTNFHDPKRCFDETIDGSARVVVSGAWFPRHLLGGRFHVLCATVRMGIASVACAFGTPCDVFVVDQVAAVVPLLRLLTPSRVFFYCHFPDQLCDPNRMKGSAAGTNRASRSVARQMYRYLFDRLEAWTMSASSAIMCNSLFTLGMTRRTFPALQQHLLSPAADDVAKHVLYPPIDIDRFLAPKPSTDASKALASKLQDKLPIVSINRFERKKNLALAVRAFSHLYHSTTLATDVKSRLVLVLAGGYDPRLRENVEHFAELEALWEQQSLPRDAIIFLRSFGEEEKRVLLTTATIVVYTPSGEHFGIVPVEAMLSRRCVVAVNDGGPTESITTSDVYGLLRDPQPDAFAGAMEMLLTGPDAADLRQAIGNRAHDRAQELFSLETFSRKMHERLVRLCLPT